MPDAEARRRRFVVRSCNVLERESASETRFQGSRRRVARAGSAAEWEDGGVRLPQHSEIRLAIAAYCKSGIRRFGDLTRGVALFPMRRVEAIFIL